MNYLPFVQFTIQTDLSSTEVQERLQGVIEPKRMWRGLSRDHKPYEGELNGLHFDVRRIIHYRNSFLPMIKGEIRPAAQGSEVTIKMQPHIVVLIFMGLWLTFTGGAFLMVLIAGTTGAMGNDVDWFAPLIPGGMLLFGYLLVMGGFIFEARKSEEFFRELLQRLAKLKNVD